MARVLKQDFYEGKRLEIPPTTAFEKIQEQNSIANVFKDYLPLSCHIVPFGDKGIWYAVAHPPPGLHPSHFEIYYDREERRLKILEKSLEKAARTKKPLMLGNAGFFDVFLPVFQSGKCRAIVACGNFMKEIPDVVSLEAHWRELTGLAPVKDSPEFLAFVQMAMETPILGARAQKALLRLMEIISQLYFTDCDPAPLLEEVERMKSSIFARELPNRMWNFVGLKRERLFWWHWHGSRLAPWDRRDFGLEKNPNTVLAVTLKGGRESGNNELLEAVFAARLQRLCFMLCKGFPNTVSGRIEFGGAYFLTYAEPGNRGKRGRASLVDFSSKITKSLEAGLQAKVMVGIGGIAAVQEEVPNSFREAELALHMGVHLGQTPCFYQEMEMENPQAKSPDLWRLSRRMVDSYASLEMREAPLLMDQFVKGALRVSLQRLETLRVHFQYVYYLFFDVLAKRGIATDDKMKELAKNLEEGLRRCGSVSALLIHFKTSLETFASFFRAPAQGENQFNLNRVRDFLVHNLESPPSLAQAAREAGYSSSRFSKLFKKKAGIPYSDYLLELRLENARRLLKQGDLPVSQVAQACGFSTASYFVQCFHKHFGVTPKAFRQKPA
jgi:AraC-like DNA-binding protein